jgi:tRNA-dihydrouridine synthase A
MMKRTDRHFRYFMRTISKRTLLYTEMLNTGAVIHGNRERLLGFHESEHPIAIQLGGCDPEKLAESARIAQDFGYDEVNLNVGCPSDRVQNARFGACLMKTPDLVARCVEAMAEAVDIEVTVKHRIGVDDIDSYDDMLRFVDTVADAGCRRFTVHARKAWLQGLSPKENRNVPPLRHHEVYRLKEERPHLTIETNGGVDGIDEIKTHLEQVDAVMIGRAAYDDPYLFATIDRHFYGDDRPALTRHEIIRKNFDYVRYWVEERGEKLSYITRHYFQLFRGQTGGRSFRRHLSEYAWRDEANLDTLKEALALVCEEEMSLA